MNSTVDTIVIALVVPVGWGLLSAWLYDRWRTSREQARQHPGAHRDDRPREAAR